MPSSTSPNMLLTVPSVLQEPGPTWAIDINGDLSQIDLHDHTTGKGVKVPSAGLNINGDVPFGGTGGYYGPTNAAYYGFQPQAAPATGTHLTSFFVDGSGNLYYRTAAGSDVAIIQGGAVPPSGTGQYNGFYGNYANAGPAVNAVAYYRTPNTSYEFYSPLGGGATTPVSYALLTGLFAAKYSAFNGGFIYADSTVTTFGGAARGGWAMRPTGTTAASWGIGWDTQNGSPLNGGYNNFAFSVINQFSNAIGQNWTAINGISSSGTPTGAASTALDVWYYNATGGPQIISRYFSLSNTASSSYGGTGGRVMYSAGSAAWNNNGSTALSTAAIGVVGTLDFVWVGSTATNKAGSLRLLPGYNNISNASYGIDVTAFSDPTAGGVGVGFGGAAVAAGQYTYYGAVVPSTDGALNLGSTSLRWANAYLNSITASGNLTLGPTVTVGGTLNVTGVINGSAAVSANSFLPGATGTPQAGRGGVYTNNQILGWASLLYNGTTWTNTGSYNVASTTVVNGNVVRLTLQTGVTSTSSTSIQVTSQSAGVASGDILPASTAPNICWAAWVSSSVVQVSTALIIYDSGNSQTYMSQVQAGTGMFVLIVGAA